MKILYAASEAFPLVKTGGLADVASGLPAALAGIGCDVRIILPAYPQALDKVVAKGKSIALEQPPGFPETRLLPARMPDSGVPVLLVDCPALFDRPGGPYADARGQLWPDNHLRFALLSMVAAIVGKNGADGWRPDVVHANDWHTGLVPAYLKRLHGPETPSVFTIHSIHYQGLFEQGIIDQVGLDREDFHIDGFEYFGRISFLKAGLQFSERITTVSPTYAREIQHEATGEGFHGVLSARADVLSGILNGVDYTLWNPAADQDISCSYSASSLAGKTENKRALQCDMGLEQLDEAPLLGMVCRFTHQKGIDLLLDALDGVLALGCQIIVLGSGEARFELALREAADTFQKRMAVTIGYDETLAHRMMAGAYMLLVPSRFEPCGLTQLYALKYGTLPVVRRTGGLADSILDVSGGKAGTGFVFNAAAGGELLDAVKRGVEMYGRPKTWRRIQKVAMEQDFSWQKAAHAHLSLYKGLI